MALEDKIFKISSATYDIVIYDDGGCQAEVVGTEWNGDGWIFLGSGLMDGLLLSFSPDCSPTTPHLNPKSKISGWIFLGSHLTDGWIASSLLLRIAAQPHPTSI